MTPTTQSKWDETREKLRAKAEPEAKAETEAVKEYKEEAAKRQEERQIDKVTGTSMTVEQILAAGNMAMGMRGIPASDIRPPQILIRQKMSDENQFIDGNGQRVELGHYFHTGKMRDLKDGFDCYIVFVEKGKFINKRKNNEEWDKYTAIGVFKEDLTLFGMTFKSTSMYSLAGLFTAVHAQMKPMYAFNVHMEVKKLSNDQGEWWIPVVRIGQVESDMDILKELYMAAKRFDGTSGVQLEEDVNEAFGA